MLLFPRYFFSSKILQERRFQSRVGPNAQHGFLCPRFAENDGRNSNSEPMRIQNTCPRQPNTETIRREEGASATSIPPSSVPPPPPPTTHTRYPPALFYHEILHHRTRPRRLPLRRHLRRPPRQARRDRYVSPFLFTTSTEPIQTLKSSILRSLLVSSFFRPSSVQLTLVQSTSRRRSTSRASPSSRTPTLSRLAIPSSSAADSSRSATTSRHTSLSSPPPCKPPAPRRSKPASMTCESGFCRLCRRLAKSF